MWWYILLQGYSLLCNVSIYSARIIFPVVQCVVYSSSRIFTAEQCVLFSSSRMFTTVQYVVYSTSRIFTAVQCLVFLLCWYLMLCYVFVYPAFRIFSVFWCVGISCFKDIYCFAIWICYIFCFKKFTVVRWVLYCVSRICLLLCDMHMYRVGEL